MLGRPRNTGDGVTPGSSSALLVQRRVPEETNGFQGGDSVLVLVQPGTLFAYAPRMAGLLRRPSCLSDGVLQIPSPSPEEGVMEVGEATGRNSAGQEAEMTNDF